MIDGENNHPAAVEKKIIAGVFGRAGRACIARWTCGISLSNSFRLMSQPEDFSADAFLQRITSAANLVRPYRAYLLTRGLDTREFFAACTLMQATAAGSSAEVEALPRAAKLFGTFIQQLGTLPDFPPSWTEEERRQWELTGNLLEFDVMLEDVAKDFQGTKSEGLAQTAVKLREEFKAAVQAGKNPKEIIEDFHLMMSAEMGETMRRVKFRGAALLIYWEQMPQEKWDELTLEKKEELLNMLKQWRAGERERIFSSLPIEDRRRLEALEQRRPEDWGQGGMIEP